MPDFKNNKTVHSAQLKILEHENEILSIKVEESLLLNKIFEEIGHFQEIEQLLSDALECISVFLDLPVTALYDYEDNQFIYVDGYSQIHDIPNCNVSINIPQHLLEEDTGTKFHFYKGAESIIIKDDHNTFSSSCIGLIALRTVVHKNRYFLFATNTNSLDLEQRIPILKKVVHIISRRLERIYYQKELKLVNSKLQATNAALNKKNQNLLSKNEIINAQNIELKRTMKNLKEAQARLIEADKMASIGILTAGIAHEINNPLNYIMGAYFGLENHFKAQNQEDDATIKILMDSIKEGIDRTANIVQGLSNFSRQNDKFDEDCNLNEIIDNCLSILQYHIKSKTEIIKNYSTVRICKGNVGKLHQLFLNIICNSVQAISKNGLINIYMEKHKNNIEITIKDNGCGISETDLHKITTPFYTTKEPGVGTGLGLSISYNIIKEHKGSIEFKSIINIGTTVVIALPI
ncbi:sensor histidine kinase [Saccharicrinis aurantiacus]|uniref:sensor histidine kinase n=1 Tax=Saccharicrinis aurantiacus TaxID=1849719 RepID=UPI0024924381|nr:ATP-binding protein [Saccharicrinis aurantiacus]